MSATDYDNDELIFLDDDGSSDIDTTIYKEWNILIVDDDEEIHTVTRLGNTITSQTCIALSIFPK